MRKNWEFLLWALGTFNLNSILFEMLRVIYSICLYAWISESETCIVFRELIDIKYHITVSHVIPLKNTLAQIKKS